MQYNISSARLLALAALLFTFIGTHAGEMPRERLLLDAGWKFYPGDDWGTAENLMKAVGAHWQRSKFNGLAQIIVQSTREPGQIKLTASAEGLTPAALGFTSQPGVTRLAAPESFEP